MTQHQKYQTILTLKNWPTTIVQKYLRRRIQTWMKYNFLMIFNHNGHYQFDRISKLSWFWPKFTFSVLFGQDKASVLLLSYGWLTSDRLTYTKKEFTMFEKLERKNEEKIPHEIIAHLKKIQTLYCLHFDYYFHCLLWPEIYLRLIAQYLTFSLSHCKPKYFWKCMIYTFKTISFFWWLKDLECLVYW